ncbi:MAG: transglutaminase domain-containing protein [Qingshengfaniella sp.]
MKYDLSLTIRHEYAAAVGNGRHVLRIVPADLPGRQQGQVQRIEITPPPAEQADHVDFFGNRCLTVAHDTPHDQMVIQLHAAVEVIPRIRALDIAPPLAQLARDIEQTQSVAPCAPHHFLGASPRIVPDAGMAAYARNLITDGMTARDVVIAVGQALHAQMSFDADSTTVDTTPQEAFARRRGVCQDFSHIMISCLRGIGVPAGYVSGFLRTAPPPGRPRLEGADAMHAWVRAWCGMDLGWVEYDPTNAVFAGLDHLLVAVGRDYADVAPVKGVLMASGAQVSSHSVDVVPLEGE